MKQFKLFTLTTCISLALAGCNDDDSVKFTPRSPVAADEAVITAIDGYLQNAMVYRLNADGDCDVHGESIGLTNKDGKIKGKKNKLADGYCVVTTTETIDSDNPSETMEIGYTLYAPKPVYMDAEWETKQEVVVTPFSHYLSLALSSLETSNVSEEKIKEQMEEEKKKLVVELFGSDAGEDHTKVLFGDFIHYKKEAKYRDIANRSHDFGRILVKIMGNKGEDSKITLTEIKGIAKVAKSYFDRYPNFLTNLDKGDDPALITFSQYIWADIDEIASGKTESLVNEVNGEDFDESLKKMPVLDVKIKELRDNFENALKNATFDMSTGLDLGNLELTRVSVKIGDKEVDVDPDTQLVLIETFSTLDETATRDFSTASNATYDKDKQKLRLTNPLILKEAGTYTYELFAQKTIDGVTHFSNAASIVLSINPNTVPSFVVNKAPVYQGNESEEAKLMLSKFLNASYVFEKPTETAQATKLKLNIDNIDFTKLFTDEKNQTLTIEIEAKDDADTTIANTISYEKNNFKMEIDLPSVLVKTKEYRIEAKAVDAQGVKSKNGFKLSFFVSKDLDGNYSAISKFFEIEVNAPPTGVLLKDLELAIPVTKAHEKALEETLETLLSGKTLAIDYSLNELLPVAGYLCEEDKRDKVGCEELQTISFAGDYHLANVFTSHGSAYNILEIIKQSDFVSNFHLINQLEKNQKYTWYLDTSIFDAYSNLPLAVKYFDHDALDKDGNIEDFDKYKNYLRLEIDSKKDGEVKVDVKFDKTRKETTIQPTVPSIKYDYIFPNGLTSYSVGTKVLHHGVVYECRSSNLCSSNQYEPGIGTNWQTAWIEIGEDVDPGYTQPDLPPDDKVSYEFNYPDNIEYYKNGTLVTRDGSTFQCIDASIPNLCQDDSKEYVPGVGTKSNLVWKNVGFADDEIDSSFQVQPIEYEFNYPNSSTHYKTGTLVEKNGFAYQCIDGALCGDLEKYEPEVDNDWKKAWKGVGFADKKIDSGFTHQTVDYEFSYPNGITYYKKGTLVARDGATFQCIDASTPNLCQNLSSKYVPEIGSEWQKAWQIVGAAGGEIDSNVTPPAPIDYEFAFPEGVEYYKAGTLVGKDGIAYRCLTTDLCNKYIVQYEPGIGADWQQAWKDIGFAGNKIDDGFTAPTLTPQPAPNESVDYEFTYPTELASYKTGTIIKYAGFAYQCKMTALCKDLSGMYDPAVGVKWEMAWNKLGIAGGELDSNFGQ